MSKLHDLKILKEYFDAKLEGVKPFEIRYNDRDFQVGDYLRLREIVPIPNTSSPVMYDYTGRVLITEVVYILRGVGLQDGYVALGERPEDFLENDYLPDTVKHVVNLSGGKDSTAMLLMMLEDKKPIDYARTPYKTGRLHKDTLPRGSGNYGTALRKIFRLSYV